MNAQTPVRGTHLVRGGRAFGSGTGVLARLIAGGFHRVIDRIDAGLAKGSLHARLPNGSERLLGGRAPGPVAEIDLRNWNGLLRLATGGSVGWYQAWEAREWDSRDPVQIFALFMRNAVGLDRVARAKGPWRWAMRVVHALRRNDRRRAARNIAAHYDLGNDFYAAWLDATMSYSSAIFNRTAGEESLEQAQARKMDRMIARLGEQPGQRVLELGCGWGSLAAGMAERGHHVRAISLSAEQLQWARLRHGVGRPDLPSFERCDYRDVSDRFDAIVSVEMVEAVGQAYWPAFFDCLVRCLRPGGRAALQFIAIRDELFDAYASSADFIQTYVFPGGMLVHESTFRRLAAERNLAWHDQADLTLDYAETLRLWRDRFDTAVDEGRLPAGFDERFVRLWRYYLMYSEGGFRGGGIEVSQVTLIKS